MKIRLRYYFIPIRRYQKRQEITSVDEDVQKWEHLCTFGGSKLVQPQWKTVWGFITKCETEIL